MDLTELSEHQKDATLSRHPWEQARLAFVYKKIKKHLIIKESPVFLDVGSGDTFVAEALLEQFPDGIFYCVDTAFTDEHIQYYSEKYQNQNIHVFNSLETAVSNIHTNIAFVLALDVMEHVADDHAFLKSIEVLNHFTNDTRFLITVPAFQSLFTNHDVVLGHYKRYTNKTLENVTKNASLETVFKGYFFTSLLFPRALIKLKESIIKSKNHTTAIAAWRGGNFITQLYKNILIFDFSVTTCLENIHLKPIGLSNYIVCKKRV